MYPGRKVDPSDDAMIAIFQHLSDDEANLYALVLAAAEIDHRIFKTWSGWAIAVRASDIAHAVASIDAYRLENPEAPAPDAAPTGRALRQASW